MGKGLARLAHTSVILYRSDTGQQQKIGKIVVVSLELAELLLEATRTYIPTVEGSFGRDPTQEKRTVKSGRWATKELQTARAQATDLESTLRVADETIQETLIEIREACGQHWDGKLVRLRGEYRSALQGTHAKALAFLGALEELQRLEGEAQRTLGGDEFPQLGKFALAGFIALVTPRRPSDRARAAARRSGTVVAPFV